MSICEILDLIMSFVVDRFFFREQNACPGRLGSGSMQPLNWIRHGECLHNASRKFVGVNLNRWFAFFKAMPSWHVSDLENHLHKACASWDMLRFLAINQLRFVEVSWFQSIILGLMKQAKLKAKAKFPAPPCLQVFLSLSNVPLTVQVGFFPMSSLPHPSFTSLITNQRTNYSSKSIYSIWECKETSMAQGAPSHQGIVQLLTTPFSTRNSWPWWRDDLLPGFLKKAVIRQHIKALLLEVLGIDIAWLIVLISL